MSYHNYQSKSWQLSKSSFVKAQQCHKLLWLDKHKRSLATPPDKKTKMRFQRGHDFEDRVRAAEFPGGINIKDQISNWKYFDAYTRELLDRPDKRILYEATFIEDNVLVMSDILVGSDAEGYDFYEIKRHTELKEVVQQDLAVQYYVCKKRFDTKINSFNIVLRADEEGKEWRIRDMKKELEELQKEVQKKIEMYLEILKGSEPNIAMGKHCHEPYDCPFIGYCSQ
ncbi:MAG TPA: hypothetical protein VK084_08485, partial [Chitinophagaceae bacterium]|nr:hypothetical protein [Chitinophagaceae bacterium]